MFSPNFTSPLIFDQRCFPDLSLSSLLISSSPSLIPFRCNASPSRVPSFFGSLSISLLLSQSHFISPNLPSRSISLFRFHHSTFLSSDSLSNYSPLPRSTAHILDIFLSQFLSLPFILFFYVDLAYSLFCDFVFSLSIFLFYYNCSNSLFPSSSLQIPLSLSYHSLTIYIIFLSLSLSSCSLTIYIISLSQSSYLFPYHSNNILFPSSIPLSLFLEFSLTFLTNSLSSFLSSFSQLSLLVNLLVHL